MRNLLSLLAFSLLAVVIVVAGCGQDTNKSVIPGVDQAKAPEPETAQPAADDGKLELALYAMSECPFGVPAEAVTYKALQALPGLVQARLVFIVGEDETGKLRSLHGDAELKTNMVQACVGELAPAKQWDFVVQSNSSGKPWETVAANLGLDAKAIEECAVGGKGEQLMRAHLVETTKFNVNASPTILINGQRYVGGINSLELFTALCQAAGANQPAACNQPPDTLSRSDGSAAGSCKTNGEAPKLPDELVDNTPFTHTVVYDPNAFDQTRTDEVLEQTKALYPKVKIDKVDVNSAEGKKLVAKYELTRLPAFVFPSDLDQRKNFKALEQHVRKVADAYLLAPEIGSNVIIDRPQAKKKIDVFFSPFSPKALRILLDVGDLIQRPDVKALGIDVTLRPYAILQNGEIQAQMGPPEIEEMLRVLAVQQTRPEKIWDYLKARFDNPMSSWWEDYAEEAGLDPAQVKQAAMSDPVAQALADNSNLAGELGIMEDFTVLVENRELARIQDKAAFKKMLFALGN